MKFVRSLEMLLEITLILWLFDLFFHWDKSMCRTTAVGFKNDE